MSSRSVTKTLLDDLASGEWVCGVTFYASHRPTFAQRFSEVNAREPGRIASRSCRAHEHRGTIHEYSDTTIEREPRQLVLV